MPALPPLLQDTHPALPSQVSVYADATPWQNELILLLPDFVARAQSIFGPDLPHTDFYFFADHKELAKGYRALTCSSDRPHCTGISRDNIGIVIIGPSFDGPPFVSAGVTMHEYGHALCNTIYGEHYLWDIPPWMNEGFADLIARPWFESIYEEMTDILPQAAASGRLPSYPMLIKNFYGKHAYLSYGLGRFMVLKLLGEAPVESVALLLRQAKEQNGDFADAVQRFCGKTAREIYDGVLADFEIATMHVAGE